MVKPLDRRKRTIYGLGLGADLIFDISEEARSTNVLNTP